MTHQVVFTDHAAATINAISKTLFGYEHDDASGNLLTLGQDTLRIESSFGSSSIEVVLEPLSWLHSRLEFDSDLQKLLDLNVTDVGVADAVENLLAVLGLTRRMSGPTWSDQRSPYTRRLEDGSLLGESYWITHFCLDNEPYAIIAASNGSRPSIYRVAGGEDASLVEEQQATIYCTPPASPALPSDQTALFDLSVTPAPQHSWTTDDGYHWYENGCVSALTPRLEQYPALDVEHSRLNDENIWRLNGQGLVLIEPATDVDADSNETVARCPQCGGLLSVRP